MECYICHKLVERHEYTRHVGSCVNSLAGNDMGMYHLPDPTLADFSYDIVNYDHHDTVFPAHSTPPPHLRARIPLEHDHPLRPGTPDEELQLSDPDDFLAHLSPDIHRNAHLAPSHSPARTTLVPDRASQQATRRGRSTQPNAFQLWLRNFTHDSPKYTTIDGQTSKPDSQAQFTQVAQVLRRTTREEVVKIVKEFEGFSCSHKKTCLELVQKVPIFPVR
ncbi:hypothetical protein OG21DRAFT_165617 [Imleria badia]|nr:hypothetical protein OG21DRAFT_165617 [Imleria badia]